MHLYVHIPYMGRAAHPPGLRAQALGPKLSPGSPIGAHGGPWGPMQLPWGPTRGPKGPHGSPMGFLRNPLSAHTKFGEGFRTFGNWDES